MSKVLLGGKFKVLAEKSMVEFVLCPLIAMELGLMYNQMAALFEKL